jgi:hypothetical protein
MMWEDDKQLLNALREEIEGPAPAIQTQLPDIVSRGLRRRRIRQASSIAAAVAVVAGVGVVAMTFGGNSTLSNDPAQTTTTEIPTTLPTRADLGRANLPPMTPISTWTPDRDKPVPGVPKEGLPRCAQGDMRPGPDPHPATMAPGVQQQLVEALREVTAPAKVGDLAEQRSATDAPVYWADITDHAGAGSIRVWPEITPASPMVTADYEAFFENNCQPPKRVVKPNGAVMQIYEIRPTSTAVTQSMRIYLPDGRMYIVMAHNYVRGSGGPGDFVVTRPGPVLTEYQLAKLGEALLAQ